MDVLLDIEVQGAAKVRARCPDALFIFIIPPGYFFQKVLHCGIQHHSKRLLTCFMITPRGGCQQPEGVYDSPLNIFLRKLRQNRLPVLHPALRGGEDGLYLRHSPRHFVIENRTA